MAEMPFSDWMSVDSQMRNWERNIINVKVETCAKHEDPLGLKAVFATDEGVFTVGASFLAQRSHNLRKAGFAAPMTSKAISIIENRIGHSLPASNAAEMATA